MRRVLITGSAGFIGFHLAQLLLREGFVVHGVDALTDYYDVHLKEQRHAQLETYAQFSKTIAQVQDAEVFDRVADAFAPDVIIHLAAQAGVRHSLDHPRAYLEANVMGTYQVMEAARRLKVDHLLMASSSSVYGANTEMPFAETQAADTQMSIYGATKKAGESMGHAYAHLWHLPTTMFRFFTVYGPWGRPDLAYFKFTRAILAGETIDIYNNGEMYRDFTYVEDLVRGIRLLIDAVPQRPTGGVVPAGDSLSPVAPYRVVNIGNSQKVKLLDFIETLEEALGVAAKRNYMPLQKGDVLATWADADLLQSLTGYRPQTDLKDGIAAFVAWYRDYYGT